MTMKGTSRRNTRVGNAPDAATVVAKCITYQFPECAEGVLMAAIVSLAVYDVTSPRKSAEAEKARRQATNYLLGPIWHAAICGVDPEWIRRVIRQCGITLEAGAGYAR